MYFLTFLEATCPIPRCEWVCFFLKAPLLGLQMASLLRLVTSHVVSSVHTGEHLMSLCGSKFSLLMRTLVRLDEGPSPQ